MASCGLYFSIAEYASVLVERNKEIHCLLAKSPESQTTTCGTNRSVLNSTAGAGMLEASYSASSLELVER